jgi:hypothetical protein
LRTRGTLNCSTPNRARFFTVCECRCSPMGKQKYGNESVSSYFHAILLLKLGSHPTANKMK